MPRTDLDPDRIQDLAEGRARPRGSEAWVLATVQLLQQTRIPGPSPEAVTRLNARFDAIVDGTGNRAPLAWLTRNVFNHPRLQRAAAGLVLAVTATTGGAAAAGHNPVAVASGTVRFVADAIVSLDPRGKTPGDSAAPDVAPSPTTAVEPTQSAALTPAAVTPTPGSATAAPGGTPTPPASDERTFGVLDAGTVTVAIDGDRLRIVTVAAAPGWIASYDANPDDSVDVRFRADGDEVKFEAHLEGGEVITSIEREGRSDNDR